MAAAETVETASRYSLVSDLSGNTLSRSTTVNSLHDLDLTRESSTSPLQGPPNPAMGPSQPEGPLQDLNFDLPSAITSIDPPVALSNHQDRGASHHVLDSDGQHHVLNCSYCLENSSPETHVHHETKANQQAEMERQRSPQRNRICGLPLSQILMARRNKSKYHPNSMIRGVRRHRSALCIITVYSILTVAIWTITCVLSYRPISFATYYDETGRFSDEQYRENDRWRKFAKVMPSLLGTISIPVTSVICAKAAAVYSRRCSKKSITGVTIEQRVASDKSLLDNGMLRGLRRSSSDRSMSSRLLISSTLFCGLAIMIWGLQAGFVDTVPITVFTSADATALPSGAAIPVGSTLFNISSVANSEISEATIPRSFGDLQNNLWPMDPSQRFPIDLKALYNQSNNTSVPRFFTTSIPVGTDTGILRAVVPRLDSSLSCESILHSDLPSSCYEDESESPIPLAKHAVRVCVTGNFTLSAGRDISEDYWFNVQVNDSTKASSTGSATGYPVQLDPGQNFSQHCQQNTTLAYFEPPNHWNNHTIRDIIEISATDTQYQTGPNTPLHRPTYNAHLPTPGPLLISIFALFGNTTLINTATTTDSNPLTCFQLYRPSTSVLSSLATVLNLSPPIPPQFHCTDATLSAYLSTWLQAFANPNTLTAALTITNFYINKAMLDPSSHSTTANSATIFSSPGLEIQKVHIPFPAIVIISVLMLLQLGGLWGLAVYASYYGTEMGEGDGE